MSKANHATVRYHKRPSSGRTREEDYQSGYTKCIPPGELMTAEECCRLREKLPSQLIRYRETSDLTQSELAALLGLTRQAFSHYESGRTIPDIMIWIKLAKLYHVSLDQLTGIDPDSQERRRNS